MPAVGAGYKVQSARLQGLVVKGNVYLHVEHMYRDVSMSSHPTLKQIIIIHFTNFKFQN